MGATNEPETNLVDFKKAFVNFQSFIDNISSEEGNTLDGYLVKYNDYENLKRSVNNNFEIEQKTQTQTFHQIKNNQYENERKISAITLIKLGTINFEDAKNHILNGEIFIIINEEIYKIICKQTDPKENNKVQYKIDKEYLILNPGTDKEMKFKNIKGNVIDKSKYIESEVKEKTNNPNSPIEYRKKEENCNKIYTDVKNYIENENLIVSKLKTSGDQMYEGFLVNKNWVDNWKKYSYYDNINENIIKKGVIDEYKIKKFIIDEQYKSGLNYEDIKIGIENQILKNEEEINQLLSQNQLYVLLNAKFLRSFINNPNIKSPKIILSYNKISIKDSKLKTLDFITDKNIIGKQNTYIQQYPVIPNYPKVNTAYYSENLKHLIRYPFFKKELKNPENSSQRNLRNAYLINIQMINKFKEIYKLKKLFDILDDKKLLYGISYENCDNNYIKIIEFLNSNEKEYIENLKKVEQPGGIKIEGKNIDIQTKKLENQNNLEYIDNFEIIDRDFYTFLLQKFGQELKWFLFSANYAIMEGKIFLVINYDKDYQTIIYELVSINHEGGDIIVEYLIEVLNPENKFSNDINSLNNLISNFIFTDGLKRLLSTQNPVEVNQYISLRLYPINGVLRQSLNGNQNTKLKKSQNNLINNNTNNNMIIPMSQITGFNTIQNVQPQNVVYNNVYNNVYNKPVIPTQFNDVNNKNLMTNIDKIIFQEPHYYIINNKSWQLLLDYYNQDNIANYNHTKIVINKISNINAFNLDSYKIEILKKTFLNMPFIFPINFQIAKYPDLMKIFEILNCNQTNNELFEEILLINIDKGFIFISLEKNSKINNNLIYIYSNQINSQTNSYEPIAIIICNDYSDRNNKFNKLIQISQKLKLNDIIQNTETFSNKINSPCYLYHDIINSHNVHNTHVISKNNASLQNIILNKKTAFIPSHNSLKVKNNMIILSDRLKVMILLAISQKYEPEKTINKAHLINPKWLDEYKFKEINSLIDSKLNEIIKIWNNNYDLNSINPILNILGQTQLQQFDYQMNSQAQNYFLASPERIQFGDNNICFYKNFVLVNDKMFKLIKTHFNLSSEKDNISYINSKRQGDFVILKDHKPYNQQNSNHLQNIILVGHIDKKLNEYKIQHIFCYGDKSILEKELKIILQYTIPNYIYNEACLSPQNKNEVFSPIFNNNQMIGYYFQYIENYDYKNCDIYLGYLNNTQINNIINLCTNESSIRNKVNNLNNYKDEEFFLVKKQLLTDIKNENNYEQLKNYFIGKINIPPGKKELYSIIKNIPPNDLQNLNKAFTQKAQPGAYEIEINSIYNPNNQNESYMIYKDFELLEKNISHALLKEKYPYHILKCSFVGNNTIVFHYPKKMLNNQKNILVVSKIDINNNIKDHYLIVYKSSNNYTSHFNQIKYSLNNFIASQGFVNNVAPITSNGYTEIGYIMKIKLSSSILQNQNDNNNYINPPYQDDEYIHPNPGITIEKISEKEYIPPFPIQIKVIKEDFPSKPLIGLENIGATCYMNATLQCLCNIQKFVNYFKYSPHLIQIVTSDKNKLKLCSAFKLLIENLYPYQLSNNYKLFLSQNKTNQTINIPNYAPKSYYAPKNFKETISRMNPLFEGIAANDAKDLVNFLLMTLHEELNKANPDPNDTNNAFQDQTNKLIMFNTFAESFKKSYMSIISDLFYALNYNMTQCSNCNTISYNYQIYFFLIFPLEEVRKFKLANSSNGLNNTNIVDIYDCFFFEQRINYMMGENAMYCNYCKQTCGSAMCTFLATGPEILIIILNRGKGIQFNVKINFYLELDLSNFIELKDTGCYYELFGVITHIGESGMGGHFIAYCKDMWTQQWLKFNDAIVSPVSNFKSEVIDFAMPYLLFYQKKHLKK